MDDQRSGLPVINGMDEHTHGAVAMHCSAGQVAAQATRHLSVTVSHLSLRA